jgi:hypothetical protein
MKIDILKMELDRKLPHWLSPEARKSGIQEIRKRNRARWLAERKDAATIKPKESKP